MVCTFGVGGRLIVAVLGSGWTDDMWLVQAAGVLFFSSGILWRTALSDVSAGGVNRYAPSGNVIFGYSMMKIEPVKLL